MRFKTVIFDLDGTVLETLGDLANAVNHALQVFGYPVHSVEEIRTFIGNGVANLIHRSVPADVSDEKCAEVLSEFKAFYKEHMNDNTKPYNGIRDMLEALKDAGIYVGINSNKFDAALQNLCSIHFNGLYNFAVGESEVTPKKPDPTAALRIINASGNAVNETIYIGDSDVDLRTAKNACTEAAWVSWGFRKRNEMNVLPEHCFDTVSDLKAFLLK